MKLQHHLSSLTLVFSALLVPATSQAGLILNGSFEDGDFNPIVVGSFVTLEAGSNKLSGWTIGGEGVHWHNLNHLSPMRHGERGIDLNLGSAQNTGSLAQSFATEIGRHYTLSFSMAGPGFFNSNDRLLQVSIAGADYQFSTPESAANQMIWRDFSLDFLAVSAQTELKFSAGGNGGFWGAVLDDVDVVAAQVPEPGSLGLFALGLSAAWFGHKRRPKHKH